MGLGSDVGKQAAELIVNALPVAETKLENIAQEATLNAADAVSDIVGAIDRFTQELGRWREILTPLTKGVTISVVSKD